VKLKTIFITFILTTTLYSSQLIELAGDKNYPPYSYSKNGIAKGVYVDILKEAFNQMDGYELKLNMMAWKRAINMTKQGKIIGFFPPYYSKNRTKWIKFSEPILFEQTIVFAKEEKLKGKIDFPKDFYGMKVCLNRGFGPENQGGKDFAKAIKNNKISLIEGNDNKACLGRVLRGMADFYINDQLIDISLFKEIKRGINVKKNSGYVGFTLKTKDYPFIEDFESKFNETIIKMKKNGQIEEILQKYK
jgi:polar amino acid transport system substrate-binding protein